MVPNLLEGIRLYVSPEISTEAPRVWLNSGLLGVAETGLTNHQYSQDAFIPAETWREPSVVERAWLQTKKIPRDISNHVCVIRIPSDVLTPFWQLGVSAFTTPSESLALRTNPVYKQATDRLIYYLAPFCLNHQKIILSGLSVGPPGLPTVTFDPVNKHYIGLHLDSWDRLPLQQRHLSSNRICINLGKEDRFLLFINLSLMDMFHAIQNNTLAEYQKHFWWINLQWKFRHHTFSSSDAAKIAPQFLIKQFMESYPTYPVVKVRISPGEAYLAPTENMIHDGCSLDQTCADIQLTLRGYLRLPVRS